MTNHPKDRHVLAAAVRANAEVIVTFNLNDFAEPALKPYDIAPIHPDEFLLDQLGPLPRRDRRRAPPPSRLLSTRAQHSARHPRPTGTHRRTTIRRRGPTPSRTTGLVILGVPVARVLHHLDDTEADG